MNDIVKHAPQWAIVLADIGYVINVAIHHGEPMDRVYDVQTALGAFIVTMWLYYSGGFFDCWKEEKLEIYKLIVHAKDSNEDYDLIFESKEEAEGYSKALLDFQKAKFYHIARWR